MNVSSLGWIRPLTQVDGPKMNLALLGWFRDVVERKGESKCDSFRQGLRPSCLVLVCLVPTAVRDTSQ